MPYRKNAKPPGEPEPSRLSVWWESHSFHSKTWLVLVFLYPVISLVVAAICMALNTSSAREIVVSLIYVIPALITSSTAQYLISRVNDRRSRS